MKLAFVIFRYFPFGGLQRDMFAIAHAALQAGHQISIYCSDWQGEKIPGVNVIQIKGSGFFNVAGVKNFVDMFGKQFPREEFDLLIGFNKMPGLDVYFCGDSCFAKKAYEKRNIFYRLTARSRLYLKYEKAVYSHLSNTHILEVSEAERSVFAKYYATTNERQTLLPPGIDRALKVPDSLRLGVREKIRAELGITTSDSLILCAGSGFKTKGLDRSLRSFAAFKRKNPDALLAIVGNGNPRPFRALIRELGLEESIRFMGGRNDMENIYAASDLLLHPAYQEVAGNVIVEAMHCGVPVLATSVCGYARYIVDFAMGELLTEPDDAHVVASQMEKILSTEPAQWLIRAESFTQNADVFSRPEQAVRQIERLANLRVLPPSIKTTANSTMVLRDELIAAWKCTDVFLLMKNMQGVVARETKDRQTLRFEQDGQVYYRKWHRGVGWQEIFKNLLQLRLPVLGAQAEWDALNKLQALDIPSLVPVAFGVRGWNPATQESFIVTRELSNVVQLDHYFERNSVAIHSRRSILSNLACIVRKLHLAGINHRDLYLCHFMLKPESIETGGHPELYLIDLHRAQCRVQVPRRWLIKDLAALYYSSLNLGFSQRESLRFLRIYFDRSLRDILHDKTSMIRKIRRRALAIYWRDYGHAPNNVY